MNIEQYYLIKLAEECNEVAQMALKTAQFGKDEKMPGQDLTNAERLNLEYNDLLACRYELNALFDYSLDEDGDLINRKISKLQKFLQYSVDLGLVAPQ